MIIDKDICPCQSSCQSFQVIICKHKQKQVYMIGKNCTDLRLNADVKIVSRSNTNCVQIHFIKDFLRQKRFS